MILFIPVLNYSQAIEKDAYDALNTEKQAGVNVNPDCFLLLDSIFREADTITIPVQFDSAAVLTVCRSISSILKDKFHFKYNLVQTFSVALMNRDLDCNYYSLIFYTFLCKKKNLPVYPIMVPGHMFVRWYLSKGSYINYETTTTDAPDDEYYRTSFKIQQQTEKSCLYLCPLSDSRMTAIHLAELAYDVADTNTNRSIALCREALKLDTMSFHVYNNISNSYYFKDMQDSSDYFFEKARSLDSLNYTIYSNRSEIYIIREKYDEARRYLAKAIKINPDDPMLYMYRCYSYLKSKDLENAMTDFDLANNRIEKKTLLSFLVNYPFLAYLDGEIISLYNEQGK